MDCLIFDGMLFQDLAPAYLTDLKPYCKVFLCIIKVSPLAAFLGNIIDPFTERKASWVIGAKFVCSNRLHYISPSNLRSLLLLLSLQLRDLCPYALIQGLIRPSPPRSRRDQSDRFFLNTVNQRAYL